MGTPETGPARLTPLLAGVGFALLYLWSIGDIDLIGPPAWDLVAVSASTERMFMARALLQFEALLVVEAGYLVWLVSPLNLLISLALGGLVAGNLHGVIFLHRQPAVCAATTRTGALASAVPALLAGGACCAPGLLLLLGIPALGAATAFFGWLLPLSLMLLGLNRIRQHRQGAPPMFSWRALLSGRTTGKR